MYEIANFKKGVQIPFQSILSINSKNKKKITKKKSLSILFGNTDFKRVSAKSVYIFYKYIDIELILAKLKK